MIAANDDACKGEFDCRGASISGDVGGCGIGRWPTRASLSFDGFAAPVAFDIHFEDGGVMDEAVDCGERHGRIRKDLAPFAERLIGGDEHGPALVAGANQLEQHAGLGLILGDVSEVVEDQQVEAVEPVDCGFEASSRRATWSFWTRSVVRVKSTFQPFSIRARPMAEARWLFPPPGVRTAASLRLCRARRHRRRWP